MIYSHKDNAENLLVTMVTRHFHGDFNNSFRRSEKVNSQLQFCLSANVEKAPEFNHILSNYDKLFQTKKPHTFMQGFSVFLL
jgi:hypothetical protein